MKKSDINTGILKHLSVSRMIPKRHNDLFYGLLGDLKYAELSGEDQTIAVNFAWTQCRIVDCMDSRYLYSVRAETFADHGTPVNTLDEHREKQRELELLPSLQKQLLGWIEGLRAGRRKNNSTVSDQSELDKVLASIE